VLHAQQGFFEQYAQRLLEGCADRVAEGSFSSARKCGLDGIGPQHAGEPLLGNNFLGLHDGSFCEAGCLRRALAALRKSLSFQEPG
jgi:hypothetical protein